MLCTTVMISILKLHMEKFKNLEYRGYVFQVGNMGNVKYLDGTKNRNKQINSSGYHSFTKGNKIFLIHRMVALAYIPNPYNKPFVNHKDGNKLNNTVENLEWVTKSENEYHSINVLGNKRNVSGLKPNWVNPIQSKPVKIFKGCDEFEFKSGKQCADFLGVSCSAVNNALKGRSNSVKGFQVKYI